MRIRGKFWQLVFKEKQAEQQIERNLDQLLHEMGLARQREVDELRGRIDRLEQQLRQNGELR